MKNSEAQTIDTSIVCPKSGSRISGTIVKGNSTKDNIRAQMAVGVFAPASVKAQAARTTKAGLMNSEG
jgi:hypothetical protein